VDGGPTDSGRAIGLFVGGARVIHGAHSGQEFEERMILAAEHGIVGFEEL